MPTSAPGNEHPRLTAQHHRQRGFTLIEVLVVVAIVALGTALVTFSLREPAETRLELEAARLSVLLETARTEARAGGFSAVWVPASDERQEPFRFLGLPKGLKLPTRWLDDHVRAEVVTLRLTGPDGSTHAAGHRQGQVVLGPEAILPPQRIVLRLADRQIAVQSDGLAAFAVAAP